MTAIPDAAASTSVHYTETMLFFTLIQLIVIILAAHGAGQVRAAWGRLGWGEVHDRFDSQCCEKELQQPAAYARRGVDGASAF